MKKKLLFYEFKTRLKLVLKKKSLLILGLLVVMFVAILIMVQQVSMFF